MHVGPTALNRSRFVVLMGGLLVLGGCSGGSIVGSNQALAPVTASTSPGRTLTGSVHGGQQPIAGAHVYLFMASISGVGHASISLLNMGGNTSTDSNGATAGDFYATTAADGTFSISGDYNCVPGRQVYLYALGGDPGLGTGVNPAAGLMAVLGNCPGANNFGGTIPFLSINEVSTVAAAYAMAGFATDALHVSSSATDLAQVGIANAFANAANLASLGTGVALAATPAGNGVVPQAEINSLANILAACINSGGSLAGPTDPAPCYTLFTSATADGTPSGTQPTDTATAAINIAHNPGENVASLFGLLPTNPPFLPNLAQTPSDFTVALTFTGGGLDRPNNIAIDGAGDAWITSSDSSATSVVELSSAGAILSGTSGYAGGGLNAPWGIAIDTSGNAWVANYTGNSVTELSGSGSILSGAGGYTSNDMSAPNAIALDATGNAWITNSGGHSVTELSSVGTVLSGTNGYVSPDFSGPASVAIDVSGNVWVPNKWDSSISEFSNAGVVLSGIGYTGNGVYAPRALAIDSSGNAWIANQNGYGSFGWGSITEISQSGSTLSGSGGFSGSGLQTPAGIAIDGADNVWVADLSNSVVELANLGGLPLSGSIGYQTGSVNPPLGIAIDGSGNVWVTIPQSNAVAELVGAGTPVVTPLAVGVQDNTLGMQP